MDPGLEHASGLSDVDPVGSLPLSWPLSYFNLVVLAKQCKVVLGRDKKPVLG